MKIHRQFCSHCQLINPYAIINKTAEVH